MKQWRVRGMVAAAMVAAMGSAMALEALPAVQMEGGQTFRVEVLQVTDIAPYQEALDGFLKTLQDNGIASGRNLFVNRTKIDFDVENGGFWSRLGVLFRIRTEASRIAHTHPDLVLTIGTPATRYARGILDDAHIPIVFTAVASPTDAGCTSLTDGGPGATGATLYTDMTQSLRIVKELMPGVSRIGMVHTDDDNGVANVRAATTSARELGMAVSSREVGKNDAIVPTLKQLRDGGTGAQVFAVPLDTYYGLRNFEPARDLGDYGTEQKIPVISFALVRQPGAMLYVGADFNRVGMLSGQQAVKILKRHTKPDVLPILRQEQPTVLVDPERVAALNVALPAAVVARHTQAANGFWQIER